MLLYQDDQEYIAATRPVSLIRIVEELRDAFAGHPAAEGKVFKTQDPPPLTLRTDPTMLLRVLTNMVANALEATEKGEEVKMWIERDDDRIAFCVWNAAFIPEPISKRIFQRHFTTKKGTGRGLGTYSMKWIGERLLGGRIVFETSEADGTLFRFVMAQDAVLDERK
jgi:signal transduction histidine kinase